MKRLAMAVVLSMSVLVTLRGAAAAQTPEMEDVVYLKDGGVVRGIIIEQIPNQSILIRTRDGNQFRFQMDQIARIARETVAVSPPPPAPQQAEFGTATKSPGTALFLSFLIPGAGQVYNGQAGKGLLHFALAGAATWAALAGFGSEACAGGPYTYWDAWEERYATAWSEGGDCGLGYAGLGVALGVRVWSMVDASVSANRINRRGRIASVRLESWIAARPGMRLRVELRLPALPS